MDKKLLVVYWESEYDFYHSTYVVYCEKIYIEKDGFLLRCHMLYRNC